MIIRLVDDDITVDNDPDAWSYYVSDNNDGITILKLFKEKCSAQPKTPTSDKKISIGFDRNNYSAGIIVKFRWHDSNYYDIESNSINRMSVSLSETIDIITTEYKKYKYKVFS